MVTLADVARAAGVSKATASRALSRPDMVAADTRERVLAVAATMGFEFNASARALTTGRTGLIGVLVPSLANPYFAPIVTGVQRALSAHGENILLAVSEGSQSSEHELAGKLASRVDGLVFIAPVSPDSAIRSFTSKLPVVTVDRTVPAVPGVLIDTPGGVADIVTHLAGLGHRAIAYVGGPDGSWMAERRNSAVEEAARRSGVDLTALGPVSPPDRRGAGRRRAHRRRTERHRGGGVQQLPAARPASGAARGRRAGPRGHQPGRLGRPDRDQRGPARHHGATGPARRGGHRGGPPAPGGEPSQARPTAAHRHRVDRRRLHHARHGPDADDLVWRVPPGGERDASCLRLRRTTALCCALRVPRPSSFRPLSGGWASP
jgi:LacI family transcriptional regulator